MTAAQINQQTQLIQDKIHLMGMDDTIMRQAFDAVDYYESHKGPLFMDAATKDGFPNTQGATDGFELARALFAIQQGLHDAAFTFENFAKYPSLFEGKRFRTADYFPGACAPPTNAATIHKARINASVPENWGRPTVFSLSPARRPTGYYLAPGSLGTVTVPASMVNKGFEILVGAHTWYKKEKTRVHRFFQVTKTYPILGTEVRIANPFGGGIYIVAPYKADLGVVEVQLKNVVAAPYFSAQGFHKSTLQEWTASRQHPAPWADFVSDKFMMQVPRSWIYNYADPATLLREWDKSMDGFSELLGYPLIRNNYILYLQVDVSIMHGALGVGYPQVNNTYNPRSQEDGNKNHWFLRPGPKLDEAEFHETGHAHLISEFPYEHESIVHLPYTYTANAKYGVPLDTAFSRSCAGEDGNWSLPLTAQYWMARDNFRAGRNMTWENEQNYEHTGHAKYVEIAHLFGWDALRTFFHKEQLDHMAKAPRDGLTGVDSRILRLSKAAGVDVTPLIHFWGRKPDSAALLKSAIAAARLPQSVKIHERLVHYKGLIPKDNAAFRTFVAALFPKGSSGNSDGTWGYPWLQAMAAKYDEAYAQASHQALQAILDTYFPGGRPTHETSPPMPNPAGFAAPPRAESGTSISMTAATGSDPSGPVLYLFTETSGNPGATSSLWQASPTYRDSGLTPGLTYAYTVTLRDAFANKGDPSAPASAPSALTPIRPGVHGEAGPRVAAGLGTIEIHTPGRHAVKVYALSGKLLWQREGMGPARYPLKDGIRRGVYLVHIVTPQHDIRQVLPNL